MKEKSYYQKISEKFLFSDCVEKTMSKIAKIVQMVFSDMKNNGDWRISKA